MDIRLCKECGYILGTRPGLKEQNGICLACINSHNKENIDFKSRQKWLTQYIKENRTNKKYDCVVGVSGGKDSTTIVKRLIENHGVKNPLLVTVDDEFTHPAAGKYDLDNLVKQFHLDLITYRYSPKEFKKHTKKDFLEELHPLKWLEEKLYITPIEIAKAFNIKLVFMGENSAYEYGTSEELDIFHTKDKDVEVIYFFSIYPYSSIEMKDEATQVGFKSLDDFTDWKRQGSIDEFSQIASIGYMMHIYTKFFKFGFQRVSDMACRFVREGILTKEQAMQYIKDYDWVCDPLSKQDFCKTIDITEELFDETIDKFANRDLLIKDVNGNWRRKDLI